MSGFFSDGMIPKASDFNAFMATLSAMASTAASTIAALVSQAAGYASAALGSANAAAASAASILAVQYSDKENPTGVINGSNVTFILAHTPNPAASCMGYVRYGGVGAFIPAMYGIDFTLSGGTVTLNNPPPNSSNLFFYYRHS